MKAKKRLVWATIIFGVSLWVINAVTPERLYAGLLAVVLFFLISQYISKEPPCSEPEAYRGRENKEDLYDFTSDNPQPSLRISDAGILLYANAASLPLVASWQKNVGDKVPKEWQKLTTDILNSGLRENIEVECKGRFYTFVAVPIKRASYVNLYGRDITDQKKAMDRLQNAYSKLKETQFNLMQAEKMHVVGALASGVAHEVKNPLAIILQGVDYLSKNLKKKDERTESVLSFMEEAVKSADRTIKGLLDFSSVTKLEIRPEDLNATIEGSLELIKPQFEKSGITVVKELDPGLPKVRLDNNRIKQVLVNLFLNAIQACQAGGEIRVRTYLRKLVKRGFGTSGEEREFFEIEEKNVVVEIEDSGHGVAEDISGRIFDPFFTTKRGSGGTGLGLSIVRNITELHNGTVELFNGKNGGATARLTFRA